MAEKRKKTSSFFFPLSFLLHASLVSQVISGGGRINCPLLGWRLLSEGQYILFQGHVMSVKSPINEFKVIENSPQMTCYRRSLLVPLPPHTVLEVKSGLRQSCIINKDKKLNPSCYAFPLLKLIHRIGFGKILLSSQRFFYSVAV